MTEAGLKKTTQQTGDMSGMMKKNGALKLDILA